MATITKVSPLAPAAFPELPVIDGVRFATVEAGVRYQGRTDVMLAVMDPGTSVAGVFTRSATRAAPVLDCQEKIGGSSEGPAAILVNSGNANAFTGHYGQSSVAEVTQAVSSVTGVAVDRVFTSSTGVIGEPLPHERIVAQLDVLNGAAKLDDLRSPPGNRLEALRGDLAGLHSIRVNDQWRIIFEWADGDAHDVQIVDYH